MSEEPLSLNPGPEAYTDIDRIAREGPVVAVRLRGVVDAYMLTRAPDIAAAATDHRLTSDDSALRATASASSGSTLKFGFMGMDGPEHGRLRRLATAAFTPRRIAALRPRLQAYADAMVEQIRSLGTADLAACLARPLPMTVICELLGVPLDEREHFEAAVVQALCAPPPALHAADGVPEARAGLLDYLRDLIRRRRRSPRDDLIGAWAEAGQMTEAEMVDSAALILVAGYETTAVLLAGSVLALLDAPDQFSVLRDRPRTLRPAVEELLRYCGPMSAGVTRYAAEPVLLAGREIPAGARVLLGLGAANRDERRYLAPHRLDVTRVRDPHFSFGRGPHYCPGAALARTELEITLTSVVRGLPGLRLDGAPGWSSTVFHGPDRLPVAVGRRPAGQR
jgi:cytochrome P450